MLVLGGGGGVAALLAARAGAGRVTAVERERMLYRMARQALAANAAAPGAARITLLDRPLRLVGVAGAAPASGRWHGSIRAWAATYCTRCQTEEVPCAPPHARSAPVISMLSCAPHSPASAVCVMRR